MVSCKETKSTFETHFSTFHSLNNIIALIYPLKHQKKKVFSTRKYILSASLHLFQIQFMPNWLFCLKKAK